MLMGRGINPQLHGRCHAPAPSPLFALSPRAPRETKTGAGAHPFGFLIQHAILLYGYPVWYRAVQAACPNRSGKGSFCASGTIRADKKNGVYFNEDYRNIPENANRPGSEYALTGCQYTKKNQVVG
ncbi:hypothetical protein [Methanoregula sp.]|uniref:hypothetical protein n=1 Tax=Methanoregula sp. TaxID=2052170 RepID=UPI003BAE93F2